MKLQKPRLMTVVMILFAFALVLRIGEVAQEQLGLFTTPGAQPAGFAFADDGVETATEDATAEDSGVVSAPPPQTSRLANPLADRFAEEEISVLQSLALRRQELEKRETELNDREVMLTATEQKLDAKLQELETVRAEVEELLGQQQKVQKERLDRLVKIYETMKPKDAATIFNEMQTEVLLSMLERMSERKMAPIIAAMDPRRARFISTLLVEEKKLPEE